MLKKPILLIVVVLFLDQALKFWIKTNMMLGQEFHIFDWFIIHFTENKGMAFGMEFGGDMGKYVLSIFRIVAIIFIAIYLRKLAISKVKNGILFSISLILAGAIGNMIDSAFYGLIFSESYGQAVAAFDQAQLQLTAENYPACLDSLKQSGEILDDLANRSEAYITMRLEEAKTALDGLALEKALAAYEAILALAPKHAEAMAGLTMGESIRGIAGDLQAINALEGAGQWEAALGKLEGLLSAKPQNAYLLARKEQLTEKIRERTFQQRIAEAEAFVAAGDLAGAVASLEAALKVKNSESISARLEDLKKQILTARLEALLANGYSALQAGRYADARDAYKEALGLAPKSKEAQTGYEKASSMLLSGIRYSQNLANADKYIASGRYPLAAKFFNKALSSRPSQLAKAQQAKESTIREILERESQPVPVRVLSDKKTYVSLTGVFAPERVESKDLSLFPDVYTLKGTRKGYRTIERTIQIDSTQSGTDIRIQCSEKE